MYSVLSDTMMAKAQAASLAFLKVFQCLDDGVDNWPRPSHSVLLSELSSQVQDACTDVKNRHTTRAHGLDFNRRCL